MLLGTELELLKAIADRGGKSTIYIVASEKGISSDYARIICTSLGRADYIDLKRNGACEIMPKGLKELERGKAHGKG